MAYWGRPLWSRSPRSSPSRGKPGTWRRRAGGLDETGPRGTRDENCRNCSARHRNNHWRAGCGESRTSGSEGGRRKSVPGNRGNSPAAYLTEKTGAWPSPHKTLADIPQIEPPFLDIAPAGMLPTIISHSKGVKCVLIRSNSSFHGPTTVLPSVKSPNRLSTTKSLPWEALLPCTTR